MATTSNIRARTNQYADIDLLFAKHPTTKDVPIKYDVNAVKQAVRNILLTQSGEKPFNPDFGANLYDFLFDNFDDVAFAEIQLRIENAILNHEPRVRLLDIRIEDLSYRNALLIELEIQILSPEQTTTIVDFIVERLR